MGSLLGYFYTKVFIAIVPGHRHSEIAVLSVKGSSIVQHDTRKFEGVDLNAAMQSFIDEAAQLSPLFFTVLLSDAKEQGAIPTCSKQHAGQFTDVLLPEYVCVDERWMIYLSRDALYHLQERYRSIGLDYIFSPFTLLKQLYEKQIKEEHALFILNEGSSVALAVLDHGEFQFASYEVIEQLPPAVSDHKKDVMDELLDDLDIGEFDDTPLRFKAIEKALETYYHDVRFKSTFIEKIYFADTKERSEHIVSLLKDELFIDVEQKSIDIAFEVARLAAREAGCDV